MNLRRSKKTLSMIFFLALVTFLGFALLLLPTKEIQKPKALVAHPLYKKSELPTTERVADLLSYMTLEEKIGQMALVEKNSVKDVNDIRTYGIGGMLSGFGGKPEDNTAAGWRQMVEGFISISQSTRLGIPVIYGADAIHGHSNVPGEQAADCGGDQRHEQRNQNRD